MKTGAMRRRRVAVGDSYLYMCRARAAAAWRFFAASGLFLLFTLARGSWISIAKRALYHPDSAVSPWCGIPSRKATIVFAAC